MKDLLEWLTSIPFFVVGILLTMRVVKGDSARSLVDTMQTAIAQINGQTTCAADATPSQQWSAQGTTIEEHNLV